MSEILEKRCVRWLKNHKGEIVRLSTNCRQTAERWKLRTSKIDEHGLILRTTQEEAEKDPTP
jgi:hypothetical protein